MEYGLIIRDDHYNWYFMNFDDLSKLSNFLKKNKFNLQTMFPEYKIIKYLTFTYDEVVIDD